MHIRVSGFRKFRVGSEKPDSARNSVGRTANFLSGELGQLGHSGARVGSGDSERSEFSGSGRALGIRLPDKSPLHFRPIMSTYFAVPRKVFCISREFSGNSKIKMFLSNY